MVGMLYQYQYPWWTTAGLWVEVRWAADSDAGVCVHAGMVIFQRRRRQQQWKHLAEEGVLGVPIGNNGSVSIQSASFGTESDKWHHSAVIFLPNICFFRYWMLCTYKTRETKHRSGISFSNHRVCWSHTVSKSRFCGPVHLVFFS